MTTAGITIVGSGSYVPGDPIPNAALERVMDTNDAWIRQRTGIHQRHFVRHGEGASDLAVEAAKRALDNAGLVAADVDYVIFATMTPDHFIPGPGGIFAAKLGIPGVPALDIRQQCAAIPFGLQIADSLVATGAATTVLLVGAEVHSGFMPWTNWNALYDPSAPIDEEDYARATRHRGIAVVFGDGAGALVLRRSETPGGGFRGSKLRTDGRDADYLSLAAPWHGEHGGQGEGGEGDAPADRSEHLDHLDHLGSLLEDFVPAMKGPELFRRAVKELPKTARSLCKALEVDTADIDCFIAHQANERINDAVRKMMRLSETQMPSNIARYGNTSAATIPILLDELRRDGRVKPGDLLCLLALGAGLHYGASLLRL